MRRPGLQIRLYTPPQVSLPAPIEGADQSPDQQNADQDEAVPGDGEALEDEIFESMADGLSQAVPPEMQDLDVTLDCTIEVMKALFWNHRPTWYHDSDDRFSWPTWW
jgi:hypothetical protein